MSILKHKSLVYTFRTRRSGFTLIEMLVSLGIFSVLAITVIGITIRVTNAELKASQVQAVLDNIRFSLALIAREMRTGINYQLTPSLSCTTFGVGTEIAFTDFISSPPEFRLYYLSDSDGDGNSDMLMRLVAADADFDGSPDGVVDCSDAVPFTSEEVILDRFAVVLHGETVGPFDGQPWAVLSLRVRSRSPKLQFESVMDIQTTVAQRIRDIF